jgi:hypothetical protein
MGKYRGKVALPFGIPDDHLWASIVVLLAEPRNPARQAHVFRRGAGPTRWFDPTVPATETVTTIRIGNNRRQNVEILSG